MKLLMHGQTLSYLAGMVSVCPSLALCAFLCRQVF